MEAHHRPVSLEQTCRRSSLQDGDHGVSVGGRHQGSMDDFNRPHGRLLSCTNQTEKPSIPPLCLPGQDISVHQSLLRADYCPTGVYSGNETYSLYRSQGRYKDPSILGRLADCREVEGRIVDSHKTNPSTDFRIRPIGQQGEIRSDSQYIDHLPRRSHRLSQVQSLPGSEANRQSSEADVSIPSVRRSASLDVATTSRPSGVIGEACSTGKTEVTTASISTKDALEISARQEQVRFHNANLSSCGCVVVPASTPSGRNIVGTLQLRLPTLHGCFQRRLGSLSQRTPTIRPLVQGRVASSHQSPGDGSGLPGSQILSGIPSGFDCCCHDRQYDSCILHQQAGRDSVPELMSQHHSASRLGGRSSHHHQVDVRPRTSQRQSRCPEQKDTSSQTGVVPSPSGIPRDLQNVGHSDGRSVCHQSQQQTGAVLLSDSRPKGSWGRRFGAKLGGTQRLRVPSNSADQSHAQQTSGGRDGDHTNSTSLAKAGMVSGSSIIDSRSSFGSPVMGQVVEATSQAPVPQPTGDPQSSRLEIISSGLQKKGFSQQASDVIAGHHRASTSNLYQTKWQTFVNWCNGEEINPLKATVPQVADFFLFLFNEKGLQMSTIKGYRSAIASILRLQGTDISNDDQMFMLIKSLDLRRPTTTSPVPKWDLALVLRNLTGPPYEPLHLASFKHLTYKTVFLLGLASAKRMGEIHALTKEVSHTQGWASVTISLDPRFLSKTQVPSDPRTRLEVLTIPALSPTVDRNLPDRNLCPVRSLKYYLARTETMRGNRTKLFISLVPGSSKDISKATISNWVKDVIKFAHSQATNQDAQLISASAHELRAISTSVLFKHTHCINTVMEAACWRQHNTFSQFYLRDIALTDDNIMSLGPIVAGQKVIGN